MTTPDFRTLMTLCGADELDTDPAPTRQPQAIQQPAAGECFLVTLPDDSIIECIALEDHHKAMRLKIHKRDYWRGEWEKAAARLARTWGERWRRSSLGRFLAMWRGI